LTSSSLPAALVFLFPTENSLSSFADLIFASPTLNSLNHIIISSSYNMSTRTVTIAGKAGSINSHFGNASGSGSRPVRGSRPNNRGNGRGNGRPTQNKGPESKINKFSKPSRGGKPGQRGRGGRGGRGGKQGGGRGAARTFISFPASNCSSKFAARQRSAFSSFFFLTLTLCLLLFSRPSSSFLSQILALVYFCSSLLRSVLIFCIHFADRPIVSCSPKEEDSRGVGR
jgi:hypothetical protein